LRARFDRIFRRRTGFATLDRLLDRLYANKGELLRVLDHPEVPLHTNGSELLWCIEADEDRLHPGSLIIRRRGRIPGVQGRAFG
jgi:hypothetical protein